MGRVCRVCAHPERAAIERDLEAGAGPTKVARRYRVSKDAVRRHRDNHLTLRGGPHRGAGLVMIGARSATFTARG